MWMIPSATTYLFTSLVVFVAGSIGYQFTQGAQYEPLGRGIGGTLALTIVSAAALLWPVMLPYLAYCVLRDYLEKHTHKVAAEQRRWKVQQEVQRKWRGSS